MSKEGIKLDDSLMVPVAETYPNGEWTERQLCASMALGRVAMPMSCSCVATCEGIVPGSFATWRGGINDGPDGVNERFKKDYAR